MLDSFAFVMTNSFNFDTSRFGLSDDNDKEDAFKVSYTWGSSDDILSGSIKMNKFLCN